MPVVRSSLRVSRNSSMHSILGRQYQTHRANRHLPRRYLEEIPTASGTQTESEIG